VTQSLTEDGHYDVTVKWGPDFFAEFLQVEYPEDVAAYQLHDWGHRGTFSMRWADGGVATFVKATKRPGQPVPAPTEEHYGPTPGALQGDDYPIEMDADGYPNHASMPSTEFRMTPKVSTPQSPRLDIEECAAPDGHSFGS
jgi:hypothetical protein